MFEKRRKRRLQKKLNILESEILVLRNKLNDINKNKEEFFSKKESLKKEVQDLIDEAKKIKIQKQSISDDINKLKEQRDKYNKEVADLIKKAKELSKKRELAYKHSFQGLSASRIKDKIGYLEKKIETEVMSLKKEEKIMNAIKKLREQQTHSEELDLIIPQIKKLSKDIEESKEKADEFHNKFKENAKLRQKGYNEYILISQKINEKKKEQEKAFRKFLRLKRAFLDTSSKLKDYLKRTNEYRDKIDKIAVKLKESKDTKVQEKSQEIEDKLKQKKKLTKEDLLVYQRKDK